MNNDLTRINPTEFCDLEVSECHGIPDTKICGEGKPACTYVSLPSGYSIYEDVAVNHYEIKHAAEGTSWFLVLVAMSIVLWKRKLAVPEPDGEEKHWSAWAVQVLLFLNIFVIGFLILYNWT